ncbi:BRO-N domain-containing protein [Frigidibacter oleivorans]|uniref:BRO-N domain-containing protein n=1 Tax=Frigidibacter oleivorans TaxID=2487129 RepID=UPI000F8D7FBC
MPTVFEAKIAEIRTPHWSPKRPLSADGDERVSRLVDTLGRQQTMTAVTEDCLYALIMMSRKPAAKRFRKRVTVRCRSKTAAAKEHSGCHPPPNGQIRLP